MPGVCLFRFLAFFMELFVIDPQMTVLFKLEWPPSCFVAVSAKSIVRNAFGFLLLCTKWFANAALQNVLQTAAELRFEPKRRDLFFFFLFIIIIIFSFLGKKKKNAHFSKVFIKGFKRMIQCVTAKKCPAHLFGDNQ